jgi:ubiquinone/menaquinone biosynthesis C-methylase UbiE
MNSNKVNVRQNTLASDVQNIKSYWEQRAMEYNNLSWANDKGFLDHIIAAGKFQSSDIVLEVGTGTGLVAKAISPLVKKVIATDSSPHMLNLAPNGLGNIERVVGDARSLDYKDNTFDHVVARYVFHHILYGTAKAMSECYRVLKRGGSMIFAEGVPPSRRTLQDFISIFALKEDRLTFMPEDMANLMSAAGFIQLQSEMLLLRQMSVNNWLKSSGLSDNRQQAIFKMHQNAPAHFKEDYHMTETANDCLIDMKIIILVGNKS